MIRVLDVMPSRHPPQIVGVTKYTESQSQVPPGTTQDHLDPHDKRHIWQKFVESGPFSWMWDGFKSFNWDLFTHPCFLTYGHQDAAGFATTVAARTGCKIWCILRPKMDSTPGANCSTSSGLYYDSTLSSTIKKCQMHTPYF